MKPVNRFYNLFLTAALFLLTSMCVSITASAAEPRTFQMKYIAELGEWRTQCLPAWDDNRENGNIDFLLYNASDGDLVVIDATDGPDLDITFRQALDNLTVLGNGSCIIAHSEKPINNFYAIMGACVSLHAEVENAYIYDDCSCNLNNNVKNAYISGETKMSMNVAALGTVAHCVITDISGTTVSDMYNVQENALRVENGKNTTDPQKYSTDPASLPVITAPVVPAPETPAATDPAAPLSPPTGEASGALLLLSGGLFCLAMGFTLWKKNA